MRMKWLKFNLDNCKYSVNFLIAHQLFDKNTKRVSLCFCELCGLIGLLNVKFFMCCISPLEQR